MKKEKEAEEECKRFKKFVLSAMNRTECNEDDSPEPNAQSVENSKEGIESAEATVRKGPSIIDRIRSVFNALKNHPSTSGR